MKRCSACKQTLPGSSFGVNPIAKDNCKSACRECEKARHRAYYQRRLAEGRPRKRDTIKPVEPAWPVPTHSILDSLASVQMRKWRGPVNREPMRAIL